MNTKQMFIAITVIDLMSDIELLNETNNSTDRQIVFKRACIVDKEIIDDIDYCTCIIEIESNISNKMIDKLNQLSGTFDLWSLTSSSESSRGLINSIKEAKLEWYDINYNQISSVIAKALVYDTIGKELWESCDDSIVTYELYNEATCRDGLHIKILNRQMIENKANIRALLYKEELPISLNITMKPLNVLGWALEDNYEYLNDIIESINKMCSDRVSLLNMVDTQEVKEIFIENTDITK